MQMNGQNMCTDMLLKMAIYDFFETLGVSLLKFQPILSKATSENCLHVVAGNNTYYNIFLPFAHVKEFMVNF